MTEIFARKASYSPVFLTLRASSICCANPSTDSVTIRKSSANKKERHFDRSFSFGAANRIRTGARSQLQIAPRSAKNRTLSPVFLTLRASSICCANPSTDSVTGSGHQMQTKRNGTLTVPFCLELLTGFEPVTSSLPRTYSKREGKCSPHNIGLNIR